MYQPRTLIVSDHPFNGECLYALLSSFRSIEVLNRIGSYSDCYKSFKNGDVDVLLIDVYDDSSHDQIRSLFDHFKRTKKLIISSSDNLWLLSSLFHMGADGCFVTKAHANSLCEAIVRVFNEQYYLPNDLHDELFPELSFNRSCAEVHVNHNNALQVEDAYLLEALTKRELEILQLMANGETSAAIAKQLFISEQTVHTHRKHILRKSGLHNTPSLIRYALEQGII